MRWLNALTFRQIAVRFTMMEGKGRFKQPFLHGKAAGAGFFTGIVAGPAVNKWLNLCLILQLMNFIVHRYVFLLFSGGYLADLKYASHRPCKRK